MTGATSVSIQQASLPPSHITIPTHRKKFQAPACSLLQLLMKGWLCGRVVPQLVVVGWWQSASVCNLYLTCVAYMCMSHCMRTLIKDGSLCLYSAQTWFLSMEWMSSLTFSSTPTCEYWTHTFIFTYHRNWLLGAYCTNGFMYGCQFKRIGKNNC